MTCGDTGQSTGYGEAGSMSSMRWSGRLLYVVCWLLCFSRSVALATDDASLLPEISRPRSGFTTADLGTFTEDGVLHNQTEKTYRLPDMGVFVGFFPERGDLASGLLVELHDRRHRRGLLNWFKLDATFSDQRVGIAIGRKLIPVIDVSVSVIFSRDFERDEYAWGLSMGLIKF